MTFPREFDSNIAGSQTRHVHRQSMKRKMEAVETKVPRLDVSTLSFL